MIELQPNNIILGYGSTFNTYANSEKVRPSNIIIYGYLIINEN